MRKSENADQMALFQLPTKMANYRIAKSFMNQSPFKTVVAGSLEIGGGKVLQPSHAGDHEKSVVIVYVHALRV